MASNSLSNADHFCCAEERFLEKKAIGRVTPSTVCWMTAPITESDASVISCVGALSTGQHSQHSSQHSSLRELLFYGAERFVGEFIPLNWFAAHFVGRE